MLHFGISLEINKVFGELGFKLLPILGIIWNSNHYRNIVRYVTQYETFLKYQGSLRYNFLRIKLKLKIMVVCLLFAFFATLDLRNDFTFCELWRKMNFTTALFCVDNISRILRLHPGYRYIIMWQKCRGIGLNHRSWLYTNVKNRVKNIQLMEILLFHQTCNCIIILFGPSQSGYDWWYSLATNGDILVNILALMIFSLYPSFY